jgi:hypothetical protein
LRILMPSPVGDQNGLSVPTGRRYLCSAVGPVGQHGGGGLLTGTVDVAFEHEAAHPPADPTPLSQPQRRVRAVPQEGWRPASHRRHFTSIRQLQAGGVPRGLPSRRWGKPDQSSHDETGAFRANVPR